jgi:hypothetical protein
MDDMGVDGDLACGNFSAPFRNGLQQTAIRGDNLTQLRNYFLRCFNRKQSENISSLVLGSKNLILSL